MPSIKKEHSPLFVNQLIGDLQGQAQYLACSQAARGAPGGGGGGSSSCQDGARAPLRSAQLSCRDGTGDRLISRYWVLFKGELCMAAFSHLPREAGGRRGR